MDKKDPETFRHAAALMGVTPEECTVYDDSVAACRAARDAGMQVVGVYDEFFPCVLAGNVSGLSPGHPEL